MLVISSKCRRSVHLDHINVGYSSISPATVRNLGVIMDSNHTMVSHRNHQVHESLRSLTALDIWQMNHPKLQSILISHKDLIIDCNSSLYGLPEELSKKILQSVTNTAARLVARTNKFGHIVPVLQDLCWPPIESRYKFKILLLVYGCLYGLAPSYLSKRLAMKKPNSGITPDDELCAKCAYNRTHNKSLRWSLFLIYGA